MPRVRVPLLAPAPPPPGAARRQEALCMEIELAETISAETLQQAQPAIVALHALLDEMALPAGLEAAAVSALLTIAEGGAQAAAEDNTDLNPSEAAARLRMARPSVMRLIARGELSSRKDGGH